MLYFVTHFFICIPRESDFLFSCYFQESRVFYAIGYAFYYFNITLIIFIRIVMAVVSYEI